jgi:hypothetical protein
MHEFEFFRDDELVKILRTIFIPYSKYINGFTLYSLPTMLWTFSFAYMVSVMWTKKDEEKVKIFFLILVFLVSILSEIGQAFNIVPGVFDFSDVVANIFGFGFAFLLEFFLRNFYD